MNISKTYRQRKFYALISIILFVSVIFVLVLIFRNNDGEITNSSSGILNTTISNPTASKEIDFFDNFVANNPNFEIVSKTKTDIDGDGILDYIILYNSVNKDGQLSRSNVCIKTAFQSGCIDLAGGDLAYSFANNDKSLVINTDKGFADVYLYNAKINKVIIFHLKVTSNLAAKETTIKIITE